jgi:hypothetical protein
VKPTPKPTPNPVPTFSATQIPNRTTTTNQNVVTQGELIPTGTLSLIIIAIVVGVALVLKRRQGFDITDETEIESA